LTDDIVARLRDAAQLEDKCICMAELHVSAAAEIERLRAELAATREERDRARAQMEPDENKFLALYAEQDALRDELAAAESILVEIADALTTAIRKERWDIVIHVRDAELEALVEDAYREGWSDGHCSDGSNRNVRDEDWKGSMTRAALKGEK